MNMNGRNQRRGIALLFVISLIVLFFLFATTFVAMSSSYMRTSRQRVRTARLTQHKPNHIMDDVFMMLLRDVPEGMVHPLAGQSLLADQYGLALTGNGGFATIASTVTPQAAYGNSIVMIESVDPALEIDTTVPTVGLYKDSVVGRWLTFVDGPAKNLTFPIIDYHSTEDVTAVAGRFFVMLQPSQSQWVATPANFTAMAGARFVVNGRPFDGADVYNGSGQVVLRPDVNEPFDAVEQVEQFPEIAAASLRNNRNLFLARNQPNNPAYAAGQQIVPSFHRYDTRFSGAAQQLLTEIGGAGSLTYQQLTDLAASTLRPLPWENPNFNGSNPNWDFFGDTLGNTNNGYSDPFRYRYNSIVNIGGVDVPISFDPTLATHWAHYFALMSNDPNRLMDTTYPLNLPLNAMMDVDNDGDGINDSFWMDVGAAPIVMADGTRVKPLVAIQIEDMDGRANLNTLGSIAQGTQPASITVGGVQIPYGQGYGPAEILGEPIGLDATNLGNLLQLRYGIVGGVAGGPDATYNAPTTNGLNRANLMGAPETYPNFNPVVNYGSGLVGDAYGTPSDYQGQFVVTSNTAPASQLDAGAVVNTFLVPFLPHHRLSLAANNFPRNGSGTRPLTQFVDNPYSFDVFSGKTGSQAVVTAGALVNDQDIKLGPEVLEALLRANDSDFNHLAHLVRASIFDPLRKDLIATFDPVTDQINGGLLNLLRNGNRKSQVTTESMEVPAVPFNLAQMVRERLMASLINRDGVATNAQTIDTLVLQLIGPELVSGLPLDLNRPFGNGRDDDGDLVYDEPGELNQTFEYRGYNVPTGTDGLPVDLDRIPLDMNNNGTPSTAPEDETGVRQILARNLYVLMLTLFDRHPEYTAAQVVADPLELRFRVTLAQWAVNVVDFRDQDSIITPFEFDLDPFNGWEVDGNLETQLVDAGGTQFERRVWGVERPDLLLTESRADHQHRTSPQTTAANAAHHQAHLPNPSAFFEVYNPWLVPDNLGLPVGGGTNARHQQINNDVGGQVTTGAYTQTGVELNKVTPGNHPVYRVLIVKDEDLGLNPDKDLNEFDNLMLDHKDSGGGNSVFDPTSIERTVFFTDPFDLDDFITNYTAPTGADAVTPSPIQLNNGLVQHYPEYTGYTNRYVLLPGHHAVVGSAGPHENADYYTIFGRNLANWTTNTPLDPTVGHLEGRPYIRLEPDQPVEVGTFDATGGTVATVRDNTLSVPLNRVLSETYWSNFAISGQPTGYNRDASGVPIDGTGAATNPVQELDGWYFQTAGTYSTTFHTGQDLDWTGYGYNTTGNEEDWNRQIVLQRLANPTQNFDPITNPYITMDDMRIEVTSSAGLGNDPVVVNTRPGRYSVDRGDAPATTPKFAFNNGTPTGAAAPVFQPDDPTTPDPANRNPWLRTMDGLWQAQEMTLDGQANVPIDLFNGGDATFGVLNTTYQSLTAASPWLMFNNRPFISEGELEMVPIQSNGLLLEHVAWRDNERGEAYDDDFIRSLTQQQDNNILDPDGRTPSYLPNFLASQAGIQRRFAGIDSPAGGLNRSYSQVFNFVDVPSRFIGTKQLLDPLAFSGDVPRFLGGILDLPFNAPFNWLSNRREPGKVNLNTVDWSQVWKSLMGSSTGLQSAYETEFTFNEWIDRRENEQRYLAGESNPLNPGLMTDPTRTALQSSMWGREDPSDPDSRPMWEIHNDVEAYDTRSTPYYRTLGRQRLLNMTTNRSSVFAVRLTIGYFRLEEAKVPVVIEASRGNNYDSLTPADFRVEWRTTIGQEYGIESGTSKRDRAFYLIDRSIPVGFVPGENLNAEKTILMKRYIE